jgi:hypothetical protein
MPDDAPADATTSQLHWSGATRFHDWRARRCAIPRRMLRLARESNVIGALDWVAAGHDGERQQVDDDQGVLEGLLDRRIAAAGSHPVEAGGEHPFPWQMSLLLFPYQASTGQVAGYNILNLWFDARAFGGAGGSDALMRAFRGIHTPGDTEFAFIHPYRRWQELTDVFDGPYGDPLTIGPMFSGVTWATFLGTRHLDFFRVPELADLDAYELQWLGRDGLVIRVSPDVAEATSATVEEQMLRLTDRFRGALREQPASDGDPRR